MTKFTAFLAVLLCTAVISGCSIFKSDELNPPQQAYVLNQEYQVAARGALGCLKVPACEEKFGDEIRSADSVAFSYVEATTESAKKWEATDDPEQQQVEQSAFMSIFGKALNAVSLLSKILVH